MSSFRLRHTAVLLKMLVMTALLAAVLVGYAPPANATTGDPTCVKVLGYYVICV